MTKKAISIVLLTLFMGTLIFIGALNSTSAFSPGDVAHGQGVFLGTTRFVFSVRELGNGSISGQAHFFDTSGLNIDIDVTCLTVTGNVAIIGGTDSFNPSTTYAFKVTDNGGGATPDKITLPQVGQNCATFNTLGNFSIASGDIEVRDECN